MTTGIRCKGLIRGILLAGCLALAGCATNPVTGKRDLVLMTENQEIELGKKAHQQLMQQYRAYENPALQRYVAGLVEELAQKSHREDLIFHVTVLDSPEVNAFALPGGYIYITRGIMAYMSSEAELVGVLAHEIGHVTARHGVRQHSVSTLLDLLGTGVGIAMENESAADLAKVGGAVLSRGYGREHELEADRLGAEYLARAGYDPEEMIKVIGILKAHEEFDKQLAKEEGREPRRYHGVFATHPENDTRLQEVVKAANKYKTATTGKINREVFLHHVDGLVLGASEKDGVLRGNKFYHNDLNLFIEFPHGWKVDNLPDRLLAKPKGKDVDTWLQITIDDLNKRQTPKAYLREAIGGKLNDGQAIKTPDFEGYTGETVTYTRNGRLLNRVAAVLDNHRVYQISVSSKNRNSFDKHDGAALDAIQSMRNLKGDEIPLATPKRLKLIRAEAGDTFASLAKESDLAHHPVEQLRLLNGMYPDGEPAPGQLIKIVQ